MLRMLKDWSLALVVAGLVFVVVGWFQAKPNIPDTAPLFQLNDLDGESVDLANFAGQTVVLNFWASWCGPCKAEVPEFNEFASKHPEVPVLGLAVNSGDENAVRRAAKQFGIDYPVAVADQRTIRAYDISTLPTTVIVDGDGQVVTANVGTMNLEAIERALP